MILAIINGLITSIILETIILMKQKFKFSEALKTALGNEFHLNDKYGNCYEFGRLYFIWEMSN